MAGDEKYVIGVDVGGSHVACCAVKVDEGRIIDSTVVDVPVDSRAGKSEILEVWSTAIRTVVGRCDGTEPDGIGFAMPGPFDYRTGIAGFAGNQKYESLYGVNVAEELVECLGFSAPMRFINDATAFAIGSAWRGAGQEFERIIAVTLGTGLGSAFVDRGIPVMSGDDVPEHGCVWHLPFKEGIADDYVSTRWIIRQFEILTGEVVTGVKAVAERATDDASVRTIFESYGANLGEILSPWAERFGAQALVFGGNISAAMDLFKSAVLRGLGSPGQGVAVVACPLRGEAALLAAARLFEHEFWHRIRDSLPRA